MVPGHPVVFSSRVENLELSGIRRLFEAARSDAVHLGIGEPHRQPPKHIVDAYVAALREGRNRYSATAGIPELRQAIVENHASSWQGLAVEHIGVTAGSTGALYAALFCLVDPGTEVLVPDPGFVLYKPHTQLCGGTPVPYPLRHEDGFQPDLDALAEAITPKTRVLIVNSPGNPTGATLSEESVEGLAQLAEDHDLWLISDEAYDAITYGVEHHSFLGRLEKLVYTNSFSKRYAMTGWRLGYFLAPMPLAQKVRIVSYHMIAAPPTPAQWAALAALQGPQDFTAALRDELEERRDLMARGLARLDRVDLVEPTGAFYAFPRVDVPMDSMSLAMKLLEAGVVTVPGSAFGREGEGHLRLSFATEPDRIEAGLQVVEKFLEAC